MKKYLNKNYLIQSVLIFLCLISFWGGVVYYFYNLEFIGLIISLILAIISFIIIHYFYEFDKGEIKKAMPFSNQREITSLVLRSLSVGGYFLLLTLNFYILFKCRTSQAIISPWQVLPKYFFACYFFATFFLFINLIKNQRLALFLIISHYFLSFSIALIIYKIGYGFDPFIHQATTDLINKTGAVLPKTFYYLGQYGLIVILGKITYLPLIWLDKLLIPLSAAIILPLVMRRVLKSWFSDQTVALFLILAILVLPFSFFIVTAPQNLAYLLLLSLILLGLTCSSIYDLIIIFLLALTALITQPIAGIPALLFASLLTAYHSDLIKMKKYLYLGFYVLTILALPTAFYFLNKFSVSEISGLSPETINQPLLPIADKFQLFIMPGKENFILNFIYLYGFNLKTFIIFLILTGLIIAYRYRQSYKILSIYLGMTLALLISYLMASKINFNFLIQYERNDYLSRILLVAAFFSFPFILIALCGLIDKILKQNATIKLSLILFLAMLITASLYLSYPRFDNYFNSHGFSVSESDINAVRWINDNAKTDYIVLSNQQVSAAALREYGFAKYYSPPLPPLSLPLTKGEIKRGWGEVFYYPIPTGGPLYQYYLDMVYKNPSRETMAKAMALAGVNTGYFVLNQYWWAFPKILDEAKLEAVSWQEIDKGKIYVFKYDKNE